MMFMFQVILRVVYVSGDPTGYVSGDPTGCLCLGWSYWLFMF